MIETLFKLWTEQQQNVRLSESDSKRNNFDFVLLLGQTIWTSQWQITVDWSRFVGGWFFGSYQFYFEDWVVFAILLFYMFVLYCIWCLELNQAKMVTLLRHCVTLLLSVCPTMLPLLLSNIKLIGGVCQTGECQFLINIFVERVENPVVVWMGSDTR